VMPMKGGTLAFTTNGACAKMYSTALSARAASTGTPSLGGSSGTCRASRVLILPSHMAY